jgi:hypothetical protein
MVMLHLARLLAFFSGHGEPSFWTISISGHVVGSLACEAGAWRLSWFDNADPRLVAYRGPVTGDLAALTEALSVRIGVPVSFDSVIA